MFFHGRKISVLAACLFVSFLASAAEPEAVPGQYVVTLKKPMNDFSAQMFSTLGNVKVLKVLKTANAVLIERSLVEKSNSTLAALNANPQIKIAEPNYIYRANAIPNDPQLGPLWGLINTGQADPTGQVGVSGVDIDAKRAWDIETGSSDVIVAVIDTGIDPSLEDLRDNLWVNTAEANGQAGVDDDGNGFVDDIHGYDFVSKKGQLIDDNGHGSHCAGTIGAKGNDGVGIVGVAWNVKMMGLKFLGGAGGGTLADAILAIDYATNNGAHIMSNSWGGGGFSQQLKDAIDRASAAGILFVAAAGNSAANNDSRPSYPASYDSPNIISVAALNNQGQLAGFSNYGAQSVHVAAPGVNILSSTPGGLRSFSGTSMACPHVSGIAALIKSKFPNISVAEMKERIVSKARPLASLNGKVSSGGLANAYYALTNTDPPPDPNDPTRWDNFIHQISSPHPYTDNFTESYEVAFPGAKRLAVFFDKFETEKGFDKVFVKDRDGKTVAVLSGNLTGTWSPSVPGDKITLEFKSDRSITKYGFDITKVAFKMVD